MLRIAGANLGLAVPERDMRLAVGNAHRAFLDDASTPDIELEARWADLSRDDGGEAVFDAGVWKLVRRGETNVFRFFTPLRGQVPYKELVVGADYATGRIALHAPFYRPDQPVDPLEYPLDELLLVHYLAHHDGVILHACGLADESGNGYLFVGHSGAGKTTTALLWEGLPGIRILSDDRIVVRRHEGGLSMHGTPWHGTGRLSLAASAPITAIFFLEHGTESRLSPVLPAEAAPDLVARSFLAFHDRAGIAAVMQLLAGVVADVPCLRFSFRPDASAVDAVKSWVEQNGHV